MADNVVNETGFSPAQLKTITEMVAAAFAQERARNQAPPALSSQPIVEERETPKPALGNQASVGHAIPAENDLIKQLAELKDKVGKMSVAKEKDPVTNFCVTEYVLHPTSSTSFKTFKHTIFAGSVDPRSHLSEFIHAAQVNQYGEENMLRASPQTSYKSYRKRYDSPDLGIQRAKLNLEELYNEERKKVEGSVITSFPTEIVTEILVMQLQTSQGIAIQLGLLTRKREANSLI
ncbi:hypothetical protein JCGZ_11953 [Jatropha curcas]|uniref:Uncharacterized protein n=1 Tax=Jatropha curcas TaxID=180498 RepID=A0A067KQS6_JATCU|nr:hypothetical protein JCGZ_11953 [Jatropha curcas]